MWISRFFVSGLRPVQRTAGQICGCVPKWCLRHGAGWPKGFLPEKERVPLLQRTKIGVNIHNSTGPINFRTYYLPANGVMQICDNKKHLPMVFELNKEVVGFDSIEEAIDLCRYYLEHDEEAHKSQPPGMQELSRTTQN